MSTSERPDVEPEESLASRVAAPKGRQSLSRVRRELSEEELSSPAVQRLLVEEIERLERERTQLLEVQREFYDVEKEAAILKEKLKQKVGGDIVFSVLLTVGAAALGYAPAVWKAQPTGWLAIVFGVVLIVAGIVSKVVQR